MTFDNAVREALKRAREKNTVYYVCYCDWHSSPDWRNRYNASTYLGYAASYPNSVRAQVFPDGRIHDPSGNPMKV